jgi:hypothetical protein
MTGGCLSANRTVGLGGGEDEETELGGEGTESLSEGEGDEDADEAAEYDDEEEELSEEALESEDEVRVSGLCWASSSSWAAAAKLRSKMDEASSSLSS